MGAEPTERRRNTVAKLVKILLALAALVLVAGANLQIKN
jgi:hypothetical protein